MSKVTLDHMDDLFTATYEALLQKIKSGEASAAELQVAVKLLKDNGIQAEADGENGLRELLGALPTFEDADEDDPLLVSSR